MDLNTWTSDQLTKLGGSDPTVVDFVLATAATAKSSSQLHDKLANFLDASDADIRSFSDELYRRGTTKSQPSHGNGRRCVREEVGQEKVQHGRDGGREGYSACGPEA